MSTYTSVQLQPHPYGVSRARVKSSDMGCGIPVCWNDNFWIKFYSSAIELYCEARTKLKHLNDEVPRMQVLTSVSTSSYLTCYRPRANFNYAALRPCWMKRKFTTGAIRSSPSRKGNDDANGDDSLVEAPNQNCNLLASDLRGTCNFLSFSHHPHTIYRLAIGL